MHGAFGNRYAVVNEGIGGNRVIGPTAYAAKPFAGGPSALESLDRDVLSRPSVSIVIWLAPQADAASAKYAT